MLRRILSSEVNDEKCFEGEFVVCLFVGIDDSEFLVNYERS